MCKILKFPVILGQTQQPEPQQNIDDINFEEMYTENEDYICQGKCYRCGHKFDYSDPLPEQIWTIQGKSEIDNSTVSIEICDRCLIDFLSLKRNL